MDRTLYEIACWCCAWVTFCMTQCSSKAERETLQSLKNSLKSRMPDSWPDEKPNEDGNAAWMAGNDEEDEFLLPGQNKRKRKEKEGSRKKSRRMSPADAKPSMFPSLGSEQYPRHVQSKLRRWVKLLRLGKSLRKLTTGMKDIQQDFKIEPVAAPVIQGWNSKDDLSLIVGCCKHGVGAWDTIHNDGKLGFRKNYCPVGEGVTQEPGKLPWPSNEILIKRLQAILDAKKKANAVKKPKRLILTGKKLKGKIRIPKKTEDKSAKTVINVESSEPPKKEEPPKPIPDLDDVEFPYRASGGVTILKLGRVKWDDPEYRRKNNLFPVGFVSERSSSSYMNLGTRVTYRSEILEGPKGPVFRVTASDDPDNPTIARTTTACWTNVLSRARKDKKVSVSGPKMFGLSEHDVRGLIKQLPNAERALKAMETSL